MLSLEKARGCLLGGAVGDALGARVEFQSEDEIRRLHPAGIENAIFYGSITDDTQMTLFTAEGLIASRLAGVADALGHVHRSNLRWHATQTTAPPAPDVLQSWLLSQDQLWDRRAPGLTCLGALNAAGPLPEFAENDSKGCGGVMRVAPVGLFTDQPFDLAARIAGLTHGHRTSWVASGAFAELIARLARRGETLELALAGLMRSLAIVEGAEETRNALQLACGHAKLGAGVGIPKQLAPGINGGGWVAEEALAIAVFACLAERDPIRVLARAVEHDGDSDSTGAIAGNIVGAWLGDDWIRPDWLERLELREVIAQVAADLVESEGAPAKDGLRARYPT